MITVYTAKKRSDSNAYRLQALYIQGIRLKNGEYILATVGSRAEKYFFSVVHPSQNAEKLLFENPVCYAKYLGIPDKNVQAFVEKYAASWVERSKEYDSSDIVMYS